MPGAASPTILDAVASSCKEATAASQSFVKIDDDAVAALAGSLDKAAVLACCRGMPTPLNFDSLQAEVNFHCLLRLLDFGSGSDDLLLAKGGRDARETAQYGLLGMFLAGDALDAALLRAFGLYAAVNYFRLDTHADEQVAPGITMSRPGPLAVYVKRLVECMNSTGQALQAAGRADLGELVVALVEGERGAGRRPSAAALVQGLVDALPPLADACEVEGRQAVLARKAQLMAADLWAQLRARDDRFDWPDGPALAADSSPRLAAVLCSRGVLKLGPELAQAVGDETVVEAGPAVCALRCATVEAANRVAAAAGQGLSAAQIGAYLLHVQREQLPLLKVRDTAAF